MTLQLPDAGPAAYLVGHLFEVGPLSWAGMSEVPLSWGELQAWQCQLGIELQAWEVRALRSMSSAYVSQLAAARAPDCPPPWLPATPPPEQNRRAVDEGLRFLMRARIVNQQEDAARRGRRNHQEPRPS